MNDEIWEERLDELEERRERNTFIGLEYGFCQKCGKIVSRSKYGIDEICPRCFEWIEWEEET